MKREIAIKIGGEAGFGIKVSGLILARAFFNSGMSVFGYSEYPSLIRGGHNTYQINVANKNINSTTKKIDVLVALNKETIARHKEEMNEAGIIIYDGSKGEGKEEENLMSIPLAELATKAGGEIVKNMVALGVVAFVLGFDKEKLIQEVKKTFEAKGQETVEKNRQAVDLGYEYAKKNYAEKKISHELNFNNQNGGEENKILTANESTVGGIIQSGCKFFAAYPMTPATTILHILAEKQREAGMVVHQTEDEISAIGAAIGASVSGVRSATATSGGGFALMTENLSLAGMAEVPIVIIDSQRPAPATGLPTWTEQADLKLVINAGHGEFPRIVMAPGDAEEAFYMIQEAFNWAEKFQVPAIFLLDKLLSESDFSVRSLDKEKIKIVREGFLGGEELMRKNNFKRYENTESGISKRSVPGQEGGVHITNSDEHDEEGFSTEESEERTKQMDKRMKKLKLIESEMPEPILYGDPEADLIIVGWGSAKGVILDAISELKLRNTELRMGFLHLAYIWPFPERRVKAVLEKAKNILLIENNKTGQLGSLIRERTGIEIKNKFLKYDGRPFFREEVVSEIKRLVG
jgi:2-oxoglutarate/2-oxoacid ferredoxin oxidoreductase subunit alpha